MSHPIWPGGPDCGCGQEPYTTYHMGWAAAVEAERARLVAGVEGMVYPFYLPRREAPTWDQHAHPDAVPRAAVLALIRDTEGDTAPCWFCGRVVSVEHYLIAGYDTFEEQRLACLDCDRAVKALRDKGYAIRRDIEGAEALS